jgi:hypothetical protein
MGLCPLSAPWPDATNNVPRQPRQSRKPNDHALAGTAPPLSSSKSRFFRSLSLPLHLQFGRPEAFSGSYSTCIAPTREYPI